MLKKKRSNFPEAAQPLRNINNHVTADSVSRS